MLSISKLALFAGLVFTSVVGCSAASSHSGVQSNYPPDYIMGRTCRDNGVVEVCQIRYSQAFGLEVVYRGYLKQSANVAAWIKLNGNDAQFSLTRKTVDRSIEVRVHDVRLTSNVKDCYPDIDPNGRVHGHKCVHATDAERHLFYWAQRYAGIANDWDLELAFVDGHGNWDSNDGQNYKFRIER